MIMKKITKILAFAAAALAFASCDLNKTPVFSDDEAFVAFDKLSYSVDENVGTIKLPLTIASIDPVKVSVSYGSKDGKAVAGANFKFVDESAVVAFDGVQRSSYIEVEIIDNPGVFTGDLSFDVVLESAGNLNIGYNNTCHVTILDLDHPLSAILGEYSADADSYYYDDLGHFSWTIKIEKDPKDLSVVWISNIDPYFATYGYTAPKYNYFYGNVNEEKTEIVIPKEQKIGYSTCVLNGMNDPSPKLASGFDDIRISIEDGGKTLVFTNAFGIYNAGEGWYNLFAGGLSITKK